MVGTTKIETLTNPAKLEEKKRAALMNMMKKKQEL